MLVSSSGWAHSPSTLIFTGSAAADGAAPPGIATPIATIATAARAVLYRFMDRTSLPPPGRQVSAEATTRTRAHEVEHEQHREAPPFAMRETLGGPVRGLKRLRAAYHRRHPTMLADERAGVAAVSP
jgi:hypothetical protein